MSRAACLILVSLTSPLTVALSLLSLIFLATGVSGAQGSGPSLNSISPPGALLGSGAFTLTLTGANFTSGSIVRWNGSDRPTTFLTSSSLTASIGNNDLAGFDTVPVSVFNPSSQQTSNLLFFPVYRTLNLQTNQLNYDAGRRRIYASVPGSVPGGNSIVPIDPFTAGLGKPVLVGSEPNKLVMSKDGQYLYVSLDGAAAVMRVAAESLTPQLQFWLGADVFQNLYFVDEMDVQPGNPLTLAISRRFAFVTPDHAGVAIYDAGVKRPAETFVAPGTNQIKFTESGSTLFGNDKEETGFVLRTMSVDASGVKLINSTTFLASGYTADIAYEAGHVYTTTGAVVDAVNRTLLGMFPAPAAAALSVLPESFFDRTFIAGLANGAVIQAFNTSTFSYVGSLTIPGVSGETFNWGGSLVRWGDDGLAIRTLAGQVYFVRIPRLWYSNAPPLALSPGGLSFSVQSVGTMSVSQAITLTNNSAGPISINNVATTGDFAQTNNCGNVVASQASCAISIVFAPAGQGLRSGSLTISDDTATGPHILGLSGVGSGSFPKPSIIALDPSGIPVGSSAFTLTVTGTNFIPNSVLQWNGVNQPTQYVSATTLKMTVPSSLLVSMDTIPITVFNPAPDGGSSNPAMFLIIDGFIAQTNEIVYDSSRQRIYASVPGSVSYGNSIFWMDPVNLDIGGPFPIGTEPRKLTVSDNGQFLYVGLDGTSSIKQFDLSSETAGLEFSIGSDPIRGPYQVDDMKVLPGSTSAIVVTLMNAGWSPRHAATIVYDNGVPRPLKETSFFGSDFLTFSNSPSVLYGFNGGDFNTMSVDASGIVVTNMTDGLISGGGFIVFNKGRIFSTGGRVLDPVSRTLLGTHTMSFDALSIAVDAGMGRAFYLEDRGPAETGLYAFDAATFTLVGSAILPRIPGSSGLATSLLRWGNDGLAFRTGTEVYFARIPKAWIPERKARTQVTSQ
jgi:hypothetical protein